MLDRERALSELAMIPGMLSRGEHNAAKGMVDRLKGRLVDPLLTASEIMVSCARGRTDMAETILGGAEGMLRSVTMRELNHFFMRLFMFHLDRGETGCARRILDAGAGYGLGWRDFGLPYITYCDRASLVTEGLAALKNYYPGIDSGDPGLLKALRERYPFITSLPGLMERGRPAQSREEGR